MAGWGARVQPLLLKGLQRTAPGQTIGLFEYTLNPEVRYGWGKPPHQGLTDVLAQWEQNYASVIDGLLVHEDLLRKIPREHSSNDLTWDNDFWCSLDALVQYNFIAQRKPAIYFEVGSGFSTMFARRAITDHGLSTKVISVDPHPRAEIDALCDEVIRQPLESVDLSVFSQLRAGDIFFLDGSHTAFMNSDTITGFLDIMPTLAPGVLVGIDDIFLPWDYHPTWAERWYGEQYLLASMLLAGMKNWKVQFPAWYVTQESALKDQLEPIWSVVEPKVGRYAMSFWMERQ
jgi:hypothetical protein